MVCDLKISAKFCFFAILLQFSEWFFIVMYDSLDFGSCIKKLESKASEFPLFLRIAKLLTKSS